MTNYRRPNGSDWGVGVLVGTTLGLLLLGIGGRAGMRVMAIATGQAPSLSFEGSLTVAALGAVSGAVVAVIFLLARTLFPQRRALRVAFFWLLVTAIVVRGLNPVTPLAAAVFMPLFLAHGSLLFAYWCRVRMANSPRLTAN
jgi:hypothetical protein